MYFDDFIARQILKTDDPVSRYGARLPIRRLLRTLWSGARGMAWGIDAFSSVWHGIDVPADHGARSRAPSVPCRHRPPWGGRR
ncbi:hypothetical protein SacmaDRAFT_3075 [Saccharomonospora marina XMU15]|uniref:Uncharacterized protein n=1 Tax=Saccharomonospora marina XMU15 TaxID=882083 RepID=H5X7L9_9PSEU|nr:hypothetical protein [Saccharomonospora marina]EHR51311.1 hypothetical protein SacmaDRAFT_3075 [Saccharomonospora marina XMU15]